MSDDLMQDEDWSCEKCRCRSYARVDEQKADGSFGPGPLVRCVSCKHVAALSVSPPEGRVGEMPACTCRDASRGHSEYCPTLRHPFNPDGSPKIAPVQGWKAGIPWSLHLEAYSAYAAKWSGQAALIDLEKRGCRGGFGVEELDDFIPGWRERASEITALRALIEQQATKLEEARKVIAPFAEAATHVPREREDQNIVAMVPGGPHATAFQAMRKPLTAGALRAASRWMKEGGE